MENRGQLDRAVRFIGAGPGLKVWIQDDRATIQQDATFFTMFFDCSAEAGERQVRAGTPLRAKANYLIGNDPAGWQTGLTLFSDIHYSGICPGVELVFQAEAGRLKTEYLISALPDASLIRLRFDFPSEVQTDGTLVLHARTGDVVLSPPCVSQRTGGAPRPLGARFRESEDGSVGIDAAELTGAQAAATEPRLLISGYFGGSSQDTITAVGIDAVSNIVVAGWTSSTNLPTAAGEQKKYGGSVDAFVASFLPNGGGLNYCTYLGGSGEDQALGLAIDPSRNVYVTGWTSSVNFPVVGAIKAKLSGTRNAFVAKLNSAGNTLLYSTYLGGSGVDTGYAIAFSPKTNGVVVVGDTTSTNFPVTAGVFQPAPGGAQDAFVTEISPAGNALVFSTYLGGSGVDHASSVKAGISGVIFVGGYTWSINFPVVDAAQPYPGGGQDGFVLKMNQTGTQLLWSTYFGGSGGSIGAPEEVVSLCQDPQYNVVIAGTTSSSDFPVTTGSFQTTLAGESNGFIARFANATGALLQSTYLGGALYDSINAVASDFYGEIYVAGVTSSLNFPVQWPVQAANAGMMDAFIAKLDPTFSTLIFSTYLGGNGSDQANAIAVDAETSIIVVGQTGSGNFPVTASLQNFLPSTLTSFITKIRPNFTLGVAYPNAGQMEFTADPWHVMSDTSSTFYGLSTDIPIVGDWTGTGVKRIGIFRNGTWILDTNGDGILDAGDQTVSFGQAGDIPVVGDWRGIGRIALGLYRKGTFILDYSGHLSGVPTGLSDLTISNFGLATDIPIVDDWSGSGTTKVGVFRNGTWLVDYNGTRVISQSYTYGQAGDIPVVGDWDSSGNPPKIGIYRSGLWVLDYDGDHAWTIPGVNEMSLTFGFSGYTPLIF